MPLKDCPEHPEQQTMVPCLECGKDFCRICNPPRGAGQLCPRCYQESLSRFSEKKVQDKKESRGIILGSTRRGTVEKSQSRPVTGSEQAGQGVRSRLFDLTAPVRGATRSFKQIASGAREHFPVSLEDKPASADVLPLAKSWWRLLVVTLAGSVLFTAAAALLHRRLPVISVVAAVLVAAGVVVVLGIGQNLPVAVLATTIALLALVLGEMLIQALYLAHVTKLVDIQGLGTALEFTNSKVFYQGFFYNLLVLRLLPSAAAAFIVGFWPFPKTLAWRGFRAGKRSKPRS